MLTRTDARCRPVAVVGTGQTVTARLLRELIPDPVVELAPCAAARAAEEGLSPRAVIVENFDPALPGGLTPCGAARWALSRRADVTVVGVDDGEGRRLAADRGLSVYAYSDGCHRADLTAKQVILREHSLQFEALTRRELLRVRVPLVYGPRLYDYLAALAGALALGVPLERAARTLAAC